MNGKAGPKEPKAIPTNLLEGIAKQASIWKRFFPHLKYDAIEMYRRQLQENAEGFLLIPDPLKLRPGNDGLVYEDATRILVGLLINELKKPLIDDHLDLDLTFLERSGQILRFFEKVREEQPGDLFIVPINISKYNGICALPLLGKENGREAFLGIFECLSLLITNPDNLLFPDFSIINCLGDEIARSKNANQLWVPSVILVKGGFRIRKVSITDCENRILTPAIVL